MRIFEFISVNQLHKDMEEVLNNNSNNTIDVSSYGATESFKLPKRATKLSAGYDIYSPFTFALEPGQDIKIPTGLRVFMESGEALLIYPRSGLGFKYYERLANLVGVIDGDYNQSENEGHIFVKIRNDGDKPMTVKVGDAFCQAIFTPFLLVDGDDFNTGEERNGGFGSTTNAEG